MSKKLYDLCRKYKYFYNKHEDVKKWHQKYHDIDLSDEIKKTKTDLGLVEHDIQKELLNIFGVSCENMETQYEYDDVCSSFGRMRTPMVRGMYTSVEFKNSRRFISALLEYLSENKMYWCGQ